MIRLSNMLYLPPIEDIKSIDDIKEYLQKVSNILNDNQQLNYDDLRSMVNKTSKEVITGQKIFDRLELGADMDCKTFQLKNLVIEQRESDPLNPENGQIWLRTDLL